MGINLKSIAKKNKAKASSDINKKIAKNKVVHALTALQLKGKIQKFAKKTPDGRVVWYWGLSEWFDENGNYNRDYA